MTTGRWSYLTGGEKPPRQGRVWRLLALPLLVFFAAPILVLLVRTSPAALLEHLLRAETMQAVLVSFKTSLISLVLTVVLGLPVAFWVGRYEFRGKGFVSALIDLPTVLPPSVAGLALLLTFGRRGALGGLLENLDIQIAFTQAAVIGAQTFVASAFFVRTAALGFASIDKEILQSAQLDGAGRWQLMRFIVLPLARNALISGAVMSWARALGEFGATILFAGNLPGVTQTMPLAIYLGFESDLESAISLSVILILISFFTLLWVRRLVDRSVS